MVRRHIGPPPIIKRRVVHQQMSHPVALVLGVVARCMARTHPLRWPDLLHALLARLIHADHRIGRIVRPGIHFQDVLHPAHEGGVLLWRDAPHLLSPRLELVFFSTLRTVSWDIERTTRRRFNSSHSICRVHRARPSLGQSVGRVVSDANGVIQEGRPTSSREQSYSSTRKLEPLRKRRVRKSSTPLVDLSCTGAVWYTGYSNGWLLHSPQQDSSNAPGPASHPRPPPLCSFCAAWIGQFLTGTLARAFAADLVSRAGDEAFPPTRSRRTGGRGQSVRGLRNGVRDQGSL